MVATIQSEVRRKMPAYFHFKPRPDQPARYDEQTGFYESKTDGVSWLLGGNGAGTTTTLLAKVARFVYETPPPRIDTPFWVIAKSYDQVTKTCWKEKLYGQGHILDRDIDWERVSWYKSKERLPFAVPLRPHANGNNWMLEFKSYEQGAGQMMAQAIGGFAFVEQFPWGVFEEVLRGCREYNFPGSKLCEYTPVDPDMSLDIEEMIMNGVDPGEGNRQPNTRYLPANWRIFHANTMCAMEAGHVDAEWFKEFFGMIPTDMLDVRMKGLFASYEGVIYKDFNPATHGIGEDPDNNIWSHINGCQHFRGIDWGAGPENDFVCVWGARNSLGQWFIYDEYCSHEPITVIDHMREVQERWQWPKHDKSYGLTFADPSSAGNIRLANRLNQYAPDIPNLPMGMGNNSVLEGIEHIQYLLKPTANVFNPVTRNFDKQPKLFIHRQNCPELMKQMRTYRWIRGSDPNVKLARNPKNPKREPLKFRDHSVDALRYMVFTADNRANLTIESARTRLATEQVTEQFQQRAGGWRGVTSQHKENRS